MLNEETPRTQPQSQHAHPPLFPRGGKWPRRFEDDANIRLCYFLHEEMCLCCTSDRHANGCTCLFLNFLLQQDQCSDHVRTVGLYHDRNQTLTEIQRIGAY
jgi:hypothetical protein